MTATGLHNTGEEWAQKYIWRQDLITRDTSVSVLLYNDNTDVTGDGVSDGDQLTDASDVGGITTEPTTGNYARQTVALDGAAVSLTVSGGDLRAAFTVTFDTTNTTGTIDAYAVVVNFQSDVVNAETVANDHLVTSAPVGTTDLANYSQVDVTCNIDLN